MLSQIKSTLKSGQTQALTITKKTQIYDRFLTSRHPSGSYPIVSDIEKHLNKGDKIVVEGLQNANVDPNWCFISAFKCKAPNGMTFYLFENDTKRFTKF